MQRPDARDATLDDAPRQRGGGDEPRPASLAREGVRAAAAVAAVTALFCAAAAVNGFPFVYSDTGTYVEAARVLVPNPDRPIAYGVLLRAVTLSRYPFVAVVAQAALLATLVVLAFREGARASRPHAAAAIAGVLLAATTGVGIVAGNLLPDVFAPAAILALALLLATDQGWSVRAFAWIVLALSAAVHASIVAIAALVVAGALAVALARRREVAAALRRAALAGAAVAAGALGVATFHHALGAPFAVVPASAVFLEGRMAETGFLHEVLASRCPGAGWTLCAWQADVPHDIDQFVWAPTSPFYRAGGFGRDGIAEARDVVRASLSEPRWVARHVEDAARGASAQLVRFDLGWLDRADALGGWARPLLSRTYPPRMIAALDASLQARDALHLGWLDTAQRWSVAAGAVLALALLVAPGRRARPAAAFSWVLLAGVLANAAVCGALSSPNARYQSRVVFLVPLAAALLVAAGPSRRTP